MSRLLVVTHPLLVHGFRLAGVEAFAAEDPAAAQQLIAGWLDGGEVGLLAVDGTLAAGFDPAFQRRLEAAERLPCINLPSAEPLGAGISQRQHIADLIRRAVGVHVIFRGEEREA